ncbi:ATP-binding protein [Cohnella ginsengisoli]|uniref:ATP-binding protein n=1 Tax=Cohnella ginsengisoli TaxID=425004 RepID=A0A9X4QKC9_9BACL|nr:ATP-binding protein [Cohnella ginsengisoli]MDG0789529.1 ATP-binding protein [Cohnella ginsengisoli]
MSGNGTYRDGAQLLADELLLLEEGMRTLLGPSGEDPFADPLAALRGLVVTPEELLRDTPEDESASAGWRAFAARRRETEADMTDRERQSADEGIALPLAVLSDRLGLSRWERRLVVLAIAGECSRRYEKWFGYLNDDVTLKAATPDLALRLLCDTAAERAEARRSLASPRLRRLLLDAAEEPHARTPGFRDPLRLDPRIVSFVLEAEALDARLDGIAHCYGPDDAGLPELPEGDEAWRILAPLSEAGEARAHAHWPMVQLWGPAGAGKRLRVRRLADARGQALLCAQVERLPAEPAKLAAALARLVREALLAGAALCFAEGEGAKAPDPALLGVYGDALETYAAHARQPLVCWCSRERRTPHSLPSGDGRMFWQAEVGLPDAARREALWMASAKGGREGISGTMPRRYEDGLFEALADKYRLSPGQTEQAWRQARTFAAGAGHAWPEAGELEEAARGQFRHRLSEMAERIAPKRSWSDLVLPPEPLALLREACGRFAHRGRVLEEWGFRDKLPYGTGLHLLLAGPPGTGKTMSAEIVAGELGLDMYRIDLSRIVSKYIGETEQRLRELFAEAEQSGAILFFDEGDALFGKRTEVKDAHDKYANMEAAYLLQRIEAYDGVTILATNLLQNMDEALLRRMSAVIKFPAPDAADRERIFRTHLPPSVPTADDLDLAFFGRQIGRGGRPYQKYRAHRRLFGGRRRSARRDAPLGARVGAGIAEDGKNLGQG